MQLNKGNCTHCGRAMTYDTETGYEDSGDLCPICENEKLEEDYWNTIEWLYEDDFPFER